jgi:hypothetical protein
MSLRHFLLAIMTAIASLSASATGSSGSGLSTSAAQPAPAGGSTLVDQYAGDLAEWAGSRSNAISLLEGLANKALINLDGPSAQASAGHLSFTSPSGSMSHRNAYIALALARMQLATLGITRPVPEQIAAALIGGSVGVKRGKRAQTEQMVGVLNLRASGMQWEQAAQVIGVKFDPNLGNPESAPLAAAGTPALHGTTLTAAASPRD